MGLITTLIAGNFLNKYVEKPIFKILMNNYNKFDKNINLN